MPMRSPIAATRASRRVWWGLWLQCLIEWQAGQNRDTLGAEAPFRADQVELVDDPRLQKAARNAGAAFDHQAVDAAGGEA